MASEEDGENLFERASGAVRRAEAPLAVRMRPETLEEFVGQEHIVGPGTLLRQAIENGNPPSCVFAGPAGTGKTTLARLMAVYTSAVFIQISAVTTNVAEVRRLIEDARYHLTHHARRTVVFLDEIHRFNKAQQDALLPAVEAGTIILIGATTENPYYALNSALLSRCRVYKLEPLSEDHLEALVTRAMADPERGLGKLNLTIEPEAMRHLVRVADGDARAALNALELAARAAKPEAVGPAGEPEPTEAPGESEPTEAADEPEPARPGQAAGVPAAEAPARPRFRRVITLPLAAEAVQRRALVYDREGDQHYDTISAFIKSMRGGDPDAALYWLARMIYAGEDPRFIARRIVICAAEDVGNADPRALTVAVSAAQAVELVGMPEGRIPLAQAAAYVASAPKSNAVYLGISAALAEVESESGGLVPVHLRMSSYPEGERAARAAGPGAAPSAGGGPAAAGSGAGRPAAAGSAAGGPRRPKYVYPHDYPGHHVAQQYLPDGRERGGYYRPAESGYEATIRERLLRWWPELRRKWAGADRSRQGPGGMESKTKE